MKKLFVAAAMLALFAFMAPASQAQVIRHAGGEQARIIPNQGGKSPFCSVPVPDNYLPSFRQRYGCWGWGWWNADWEGPHYWWWHEHHHWWWRHHHHWWWRHHHCHCHW